MLCRALAPGGRCAAPPATLRRRQGGRRLRRRLAAVMQAPGQRILSRVLAAQGGLLTQQSYAEFEKVRGRGAAKRMCAQALRLVETCRALLCPPVACGHALLPLKLPLTPPQVSSPLAPSPLHSPPPQVIANFAGSHFVFAKTVLPAMRKSEHSSLLFITGGVGARR